MTLRERAPTTARTAPAAAAAPTATIGGTAPSRSPATAAKSTQWRGCAARTVAPARVVVPSRRTPIASHADLVAQRRHPRLSDARHLIELFHRAEPAVGLAVADDVLRGGRADAVE